MPRPEWWDAPIETIEEREPTLTPRERRVPPSPHPGPISCQALTEVAAYIGVGAALLIAPIRNIIVAGDWSWFIGVYGCIGALTAICVVCNWWDGVLEKREEERMNKFREIFEWKKAHPFEEWLGEWPGPRPKRWL